MPLLLLSFAGALLFVTVFGGALSLRAWRRTDLATKALIKRVTRLSWRKKLSLARGLATDARIPLRARLIPPALVLYLAMPIDIIPDFIPVIGLMDDVIVMAVGVGLLLRLVPRSLLEEQIASLERSTANDGV